MGFDNSCLFYFLGFVSYSIFLLVFGYTDICPFLLACSFTGSLLSCRRRWPSYPFTVGFLVHLIISYIYIYLFGKIPDSDLSVLSFFLTY
jgi:hypothetical protein